MNAVKFLGFLVAVVSTLAWAQERRDGDRLWRASPGVASESERLASSMSCVTWADANLPRSSARRLSTECNREPLRGFFLRSSAAATRELTECFRGFRDAVENEGAILNNCSTAISSGRWSSSWLSSCRASFTRLEIEGVSSTRVCYEIGVRTRPRPNFSTTGPEDWNLIRDCAARLSPRNPMEHASSGSRTAEGRVATCSLILGAESELSETYRNTFLRCLDQRGRGYGATESIRSTTMVPGAILVDRCATAASNLAAPSRGVAGGGQSAVTEGAR